MLDPLKRKVRLAHRARLHPLGFELDLRSNDQRVLQAARQSWGRFEKCFDSDPLKVCIAVAAGTDAKLPPEPVFRARRHLTSIVADRMNFATLDYSQGMGFAWVTEPVVENAHFFRWFFLEAMVYCLLTERYLTPIHTGCVAREGRGLLLLGESGAGKSTLTFACARRGWSLVSDDVAWLVRSDRNRRVLGRPHHLRLRPDTAALFPELKNRPAGLAVNGKPAIEIALQEFPAIALATECEVAASIFLRRDGSQPPSLRPLPADAVYRRLAAGLIVFDAPVRREQLASLRRLAGAPAYELHYREAASATQVLRDVLGDVP